MAQRYNTGNPRPSNSMKDVNDNTLANDDYLNSEADTFIDRLRDERDTLRGSTKKMFAVGSAAVKVAQDSITILGLPFTTREEAQTTADEGKIPVGAVTWARNVGDASLADELINNGGTLEITGRNMPSQSGVDKAIGYVLNGAYPTDNSTSWEITNNLVMFSDGSTAANASWNAYYIPCKKMDQIDYFGVINTTTVGSISAWIIQCDANKKYVKTLTTTVSTGVATQQGTVHGTATQDGFFYVRVRNSANPNWNINYQKKRLITSDNYLTGVSQISKGLWPESASSIWSITTKFVIFSGGLSGTYDDWDAYYVPCRKGDLFEYYGSINTSTVGGISGWIIQCDPDKKYVSDLATSISTGIPAEQGVLFGTAVQDGYVYIRVRNNSNPAWYINFLKKHLLISSELGAPGGVAEYDALKAVSDNGKTTDYTKNGNYYAFGTVINFDGTINNNAGNDWLAYYLPVSEGDKVTMSGICGAATVGAKMAYFIQLDHDRNFIEPLDIYTSTGQQNVQMTRSVFASQDGVMYVRVRRILGGVAQDYSVTAFQRSYKLLQDIYALQNQVDDLINNGAVQTSVIGATLEKLPIKFDNRYNYNEQMFIQDNVVVAGNYTFVVGTRNSRHSMIMRKDNMSSVWTYFDLHYVTGNPLASPTAEDCHNGYSLGVTKDGYIIVSGNMHADPCCAVISNVLYDITAWTAISYTASPQVSYPRFVKYPDGISQAFWRQGVSAAGQYFSALFDDTTRTFDAVFQIVATDLNVNAYEQRLGIGRDGSLHMCFGLRVDAGTADANRGLYYVKLMDKGLTWTNAAGTVNYPAPLTETNSEKIADIALYSGYVNQNGGACDYDGHYHTSL